MVSPKSNMFYSFASPMYLLKVTVLSRSHLAISWKRHTSCTHTGLSPATPAHLPPLFFSLTRIISRYVCLSYLCRISLLSNKRSQPPPKKKRSQPHLHLFFWMIDSHYASLVLGWSPNSPFPQSNSQVPEASSHHSVMKMRQQCPAHSILQHPASTDDPWKPSNDQSCRHSASTSAFPSSDSHCHPRTCETGVLWPLAFVHLFPSPKGPHSIFPTGNYFLNGL